MDERVACLAGIVKNNRKKRCSIPLHAFEAHSLALIFDLQYLF